MSGLVDAIADDEWRDWARRLPQPAHPQPDAVAAHRSALERALADAPRRIDRLDPPARRSLIALRNQHLRRIGSGLRREARAAEAAALAGAVGPVADLLRLAGLRSPQARAGGLRFEAGAGRGRKQGKARLDALQAPGSRCGKLIDLPIAGLLG